MSTAFYIPPSTKTLISPYESHPKGKLIPVAKPFTVSMLAAVVAEDLDGFLRGKNDVLIMSKSAMGEQPKVDRIHFYEEEVPAGKPIKNIFADTVFVDDDYEGERLWLEFNIVEVDTTDSERETAVRAFQSLAGTAGAVFPVALPYTFAASAAAGLLHKLTNALEDDDQVIRTTFALYGNGGSVGRAALREGVYVMFPQPQDPSHFKLEPNGTLSRGGKAPGVSYAVFDIRPQKQVSPSFVINQKMATLLTQLSDGNDNSAQSSIKFLEDTLIEYSNFRKLERYLELKEKQDLTAEEKDLMAEIAKIESIKPFIP